MSNETKSVTYTQGRTVVWSDGEKITVKNSGGLKWVKDNVEQIFGMGEWDKIVKVSYTEVDYARIKNSNIKGYECVSGYIPQRVISDLAEELPEKDERQAALDALKEI